MDTNKMRDQVSVDKEKLRELAQAATHGERELWDVQNINPLGLNAIPVAIPSQMAVLCHVFGTFNPMMDSYIGAASYRKDAEFIAAATPENLLSLLNEIEKLKAENEALRNLKIPHYLKLSEHMRKAGEHSELRAREDQCSSVPVLKAVFFEAAIQVWLDDQNEAIDAAMAREK